MIDHLDHLVRTSAHETECIRFCTEVLGMQMEFFIGGTPPIERKAFKFGHQKINLHVKGREFEPKAHTPVPGSLDLCVIAAVPLETVIARLQAAEVSIVAGPVLRTRLGPSKSRSPASSYRPYHPNRFPRWPMAPSPVHDVARRIKHRCAQGIDAGLG